MRILHRSPKHTAARRPSRSLARALHNAPTQASRQELVVLQGMGR